MAWGWAGQTVSIHFEARQRQFIFTQVKPQTKRGQERPEWAPICLEAQGLTLEKLTDQGETSSYPARGMTF